MPRFRLGLAAAVLVAMPSVLFARAPGASDSDLAAKLVGFEAVLEEISAARASGEWTTPGWKPIITRSYLNDLVDEVRRVTQRENLKLPIDFNGLTPPPSDGSLANQRDRLHVVKDAKLPYPISSLVLAEGNLHIARAEDCVIIARGAVCIGNSRNCVILAGHYLQLYVDTQDLLPTQSTVNLLMSGDLLRVTGLSRSICCGMKRIEIGGVDAGLTVLNSPPVVIKDKTPIRTIDAPHLPFQAAPERDPLAGKLQIVQLLTGRIAVRETGYEYELRVGSPLNDAKGRPIRGLEGWTLNFITADYALFSNGRRWAGYYMPP